MTTTFTVPAPHLRQALQTASAFMPGDYILPALAGVHMAPAGDRVAFTATDRYMASYETLKIEGEPFTATVPGRVVAALIAVLTPIDVQEDDEDGPVPPIEPFESATAVLADDGKQVTVRLAGLDEIAVTFVPVSGMFVSIPKILEEAEARGGEPLAGAHFTPRVLAAALDAVRQRQDAAPYIEPLEIVSAAAGKPMLIRYGDDLKVLIMSVEVPND